MVVCFSGYCYSICSYSYIHAKFTSNFHIIEPFVCVYFGWVRHEVSRLWVIWVWGATTRGNICYVSCVVPYGINSGIFHSFGEYFVNYYSKPNNTVLVWPQMLRFSKEQRKHCTSLWRMKPTLCNYSDECRHFSCCDHRSYRTK